MRTFVLWWMAGFALWLVLEDLATLPECIDGAVAATLGAGAATAACRAAPPVHWPHGGSALVWRSLRSLVAGLPSLVTTLVEALVAGRRDPGQLNVRGFTPDAEPARRAGQVALATIAGSLAPGSVVVAVDCDGHRMIVHELRSSRGGHEPEPRRAVG